MDSVSHPNALIRSALFVDFDNIYIGLSKTDPLAAERFASDPARWLAWLEKGLPGIPGVARESLGQEGAAEPSYRRSILIRRCYPNPDAGFRRYRSFFTSAAFSVIDCPSLTRTGKNSSDIYMVMDILDTLNHKTCFDEFIIFSGDSDFMPVLLRLRAHDRRTTTLAIDFMPPAFKAACDMVISEEEFMEEALGVTQEGSAGNGLARARLEMPLLKEMVQRVFETVRQEGEVAGAELPDILKDFREFRESSNWMGFGTSQRLAEAMVHQEPRLALVRINPVQYKLSFKSGAGEPGRSVHVEPVETRAPTVRIDGQAPIQEDSLESSLRKQIVAAVQEVVRSSNTPVLLARASQYVVSKVGPRVLETQWVGTGSFKRLLLSIEDLGLEITSHPEPGYIFDSGRHTHPSQRGPRRSAGTQEGDALSDRPQAERYPARRDYINQAYTAGEAGPEDEMVESLPSLKEFARRVSQVTGAPLLTSEEYALVFRGVHAEVLQIAEGHKTYNTYQSAKAVSDWCAAQGSPVPHHDIVLVFKGIIFQDGARFGKQPGSYSPLEIARVIRDNIQALCQRSRLELTDHECCLLDSWILGGLESETPCEQTHEEAEAGGA